MKWQCVWLGVVCAVLAGCGEEAPPSGSGAPAVLVLPVAFHGVWEHVGTSGGLDGSDVPMPEGKPARLRITAGNVLERIQPDGTVRGERFTVTRGKTIFSTEDQWMIHPARGGEPLVLQIHPDGSLGMSENVYDGFGSSYRRPGP